MYTWEGDARSFKKNIFSRWPSFVLFITDFTFLRFSFASCLWAYTWLTYITLKNNLKGSYPETCKPSNHKLPFIVFWRLFLWSYSLCMKAFVYRCLTWLAPCSPARVWASRKCCWRRFFEQDWISIAFVSILFLRPAEFLFSGLYIRRSSHSVFTDSKS